MKSITLLSIAVVMMASVQYALASAGYGLGGYNYAHVYQPRGYVKSFNTGFEEKFGQDNAYYNKDYGLNNQQYYRNLDNGYGKGYGNQYSTVGKAHRDLAYNQNYGDLAHVNKNYGHRKNANGINYGHLGGGYGGAYPNLGYGAGPRGYGGGHGRGVYGGGVGGHGGGGYGGGAVGGHGGGGYGGGAVGGYGGGGRAGY